MDNIQYVAFNEYDSPVTYEEAGGDGFKQVLGIVVPLLIPIAAPFIASAIGLSGALSGVIGTLGTSVANAATGAVLGAGVSSATGGDVGMGAITGAMGGFTGGGGFGESAVAGTANAGTKAAEIAANGSKALNVASATPSFMPNASGAGLSLPGGAQVGLFGNKPQVAGIINNASGGSGVAANLGVGQNVIQRLARVPGQIVQQMGGMDRVLALVTRAAAQGVTGDPYMQDAIDARRAELDAERATNQRLFDHRLAVSNRILGEADYNNPQQGGTEAAVDYTTRVNNQEEEALRDLAGRGGYNTGQRESISRRAGLARGRGAASAFLEGAANAETRRGQRRSEALQWLPANAPNNSASQSQLDEMQRRVRGEAIDEAGQWTGFFTADPYRPNEEEQWGSDRVGLWTRR